jgi:DNA primase
VSEARDLRRAHPLDDPHALAVSLGFRSRRQPGGVLVSCPAHDERSPSCSLTLGPDGTVRVRCFGCGFSGDALGFVAAVRGLDARRDFAAVLKEAGELTGSCPTPSPKRARPAGTGGEPVTGKFARDWELPVLDLDEELRLVLHPLDSPWSRPAALYLEERGIYAGALADGWRWLDVEELKHTTEERIALGGDPTRSVFAAAGLLRCLDDAVLPRFAEHVLCIPWRDPEGRVRTLQRRSLGSSATKFSRYVFPKGHSPKHPYGCERLRAAAPDAELVFVEGAADVLARRAVDDGGRVVLGLPGTDGWRPEWAELARGRRVRISLDADAAGDRAVDDIAADLYRAGAVRVARERVRGAKDWGEALLKRAP